MKSGRQQARWTVNGVDHTRTFETEREAQEFLILTQASLIRDGWSDPALSGITLASYVDFWLLSHADIRDSTRNLYESLAKRFILGPFDEEPVAVANPRLGELRLREVTTHHVATWHQWVREVSARGMMRKQEITPGSPRENLFIRAWARECCRPRRVIMRAS